MFDVSINWLLVGLLSMAAWIAGFLWFVVIFGKQYMTGHGRTKAQLDQGPSMPIASLYQLIGSFLQVGTLAWLVALTGANSASEGLLLGLLVWFGILLAYIGPMYAFQAYSLRYAVIVIGYPLVVLAAAGTVLAAV